MDPACTGKNLAISARLNGSAFTCGDGPAFAVVSGAMKPLVITALVTIAGALAVVACGGVDTGFRNGPGGSLDSTSPPEGSSGAPGGEAQDAGEDDDAAPSDAATSSSGNPVDAADAAKPGPTAFTGAPAYVATTGPSTLNAGHSKFNAQNDPAGRPCLNCHGAGGGAAQFTFAGTVFKDAAGTMPAAQIEIRLRDANGKGLSAYSDANGNFFLPLNPNGDLAFPVHAGGRDANTKKLMNATTTNGNCNGCHKPGAQGHIVVP